MQRHKHSKSAISRSHPPLLGSYFNDTLSEKEEPTRLRTRCFKFANMHSLDSGGQFGGGQGEQDGRTAHRDRLRGPNAEDDLSAELGFRSQDFYCAKDCVNLKRRRCQYSRVSFMQHCQSTTSRNTVLRNTKLCFVMRMIMIMMHALGVSSAA